MASAGAPEDYATKIARLQQACLRPLKEDLADWLNSIIKITYITTDNFMDKLDNGVVICRLAKIISQWCDQLGHSPNHSSAPFRPVPLSAQARSLSTNCLSISSSPSATTAIQSPMAISCLMDFKIWEDAKCRTFYARDNVCNFIKWSKEFGVNQSVLFESDDLVLHANPRQVILCLLDVARIACVKYGFTEAPGLVKFEQEIDRELAAEKAQACKDGFTDQELSELNSSSDNIASRANGSRPNVASLSGRRFPGFSTSSTRNGSIGGDVTDDLIMRYCMHKEEEAARKRAAEMDAAAAKAEAEAARLVMEQDKIEANEVALVSSTTDNETIEVNPTNVSDDLEASDKTMDATNGLVFDAGLDLTSVTIRNDDETIGSPIDRIVTEGTETEDLLIKSPLSNDSASNKNAHLMYDTRVDSLDSGEGRTESASTSHSRTPINSSADARKHETSSSSIPIAITRSNSSSSLTSNTSSIGTSELSSSRSSLLSGHDSNSTNTTATKRHVAASDLDGKVMRIAKSYYGKGVTKGVKRLSEGKYKIADRIVFVRLLKGHRVMVRIGGGWDTLENFLFRHKSDPSQVIDVDNLLPLETKMTFDKAATTGATQTPAVTQSGSAASTPIHNRAKYSRLPFYQRSSSASSTNLSLSNLSFSNQSPASSSATSTTNVAAASSSSQTPNVLLDFPVRPQTSARQSAAPSPYLLIHRGQSNRQQANGAPQSVDRLKSKQKLPASSSHYNYSRPLGSSKTPTASSTNLYPATLTTRVTTPANSKLAKARLNSTSDLHSDIISGQANIVSSTSATPRKSYTLTKLGRSSDSLQASLSKSVVVGRQNNHKGSSQSETFGFKRRPESNQRNTLKGLVRQANSVTG